MLVTGYLSFHIFLPERETLTMLSFARIQWAMTSMLHKPCRYWLELLNTNKSRATRLPLLMQVRLHIICFATFFYFLIHVFFFPCTKVGINKDKIHKFKKHWYRPITILNLCIVPKLYNWYIPKRHKYFLIWCNFTQDAPTLLHCKATPWPL